MLFPVANCAYLDCPSCNNVGKADFISIKTLLSPMSPKRSQITIFMILGLVILFVFVFLFQIVEKAKTKELENVKENVYGKNFKKESARIFIQDCLYDGIEEGLLLIGKQGRLWNDQPGGRQNFLDQKTGTIFPGENESEGRVYYGIAAERYDEAAKVNAYPCNDAENPPAFCGYTYPNTSIGFGELKLKKSTIAEDLGRYLEETLPICVEHLLQERVSSAATTGETELQTDVSLKRDGLVVDVSYPLKFSVGREEFFHLSTFDFFYPTRLDELLDAAVTLPLLWDYRYVDFNYTEEQLQQEEFTYGREENFNCHGLAVPFYCTLRTRADLYQALSIDWEKITTSAGDDLFIFRPADQTILTSPRAHPPFEFRIARQNRPPALDYIHRQQCDAQYDYLVVPGDENLGELHITANAIDPDEDSLTYTISGDLGNNNPLILDRVTLQNMESKIYTVTVTAIDQHQAEDWQDVRVLIDTPIQGTVQLELPYSGVASEAGGVYFTSAEDPLHVKITTPERSVTGEQSNTILSYTDNTQSSNNFQYSIPGEIRPQENCFMFPWTDNYDGCNIKLYTLDDLKRWPEMLASKQKSHFKKGSLGNLDLTVSKNMCNNFEVSNTQEAHIETKDCVPYKDPTHPFAAPYHGYKFMTYNFQTQQGDFSGNKNDNINPFLATHSCCAGNPNIPGTWVLEDEGTVCFIDPTPQCWGKNFTVAAGAGYVLEQEIATCDGTRGNYCAGAKEYHLWQGKLICGDGQAQCSDDRIETDCRGKDAFSALDENNDNINEAMCFGTLGCASLCNQPIASQNAGDVRGVAYNLNQRMISAQATSPTEIKFFCGCRDNRGRILTGAACDSDLNHIFDGVCQADGGCA